METFETFAARVNAAYADQPLFVEGRRVYSYGKSPATIWGNGTLSVDVCTKKGNKVTQLWYKVGSELPIVEGLEVDNSLQTMWAKAVEDGVLKEMPKL